MQRRQLIATTAGILGGTTLLATTSNHTKAHTGRVNTLTVPDVTATTHGAAIDTVTLTVDATYSYDSTHNIDRYTLTLLSGDRESTIQPIATSEHTDGDFGQSGSGTETLSGDILSTYHYSRSDFEPVNGQEVSHAVWAGIQLQVWVNGDRVVDELATDACRVTVDGAELEVSGQVGGDGEIVIETTA